MMAKRVGRCPSSANTRQSKPREMRRDTDGRDGRVGETVTFLNDEDHALLFGVFDKSKQQIAV
jgi:hypothetical protein